MTLGNKICDDCCNKRTIINLLHCVFDFHSYNYYGTVTVTVGMIIMKCNVYMIQEGIKINASQIYVPFPCTQI